MIRVLTVDDSRLARAWLVDCMRSDPEINVVGEAADGQKAVAMTATLQPDVIVMDMAMPIMNGIEATKQIMARCPTPILIVSGSNNRIVNLSILDALAAGAVDAFDKPGEDESKKRWREDFLRRLHVVAGVRVIRHINGSTPERPARPAATAAKPVELVAIGASTGGTEILHKMLRVLSPLPVPLLLVIHFPDSLFNEFVEWLGAAARMPVIAAGSGLSLESLKGVVCVARPDRHLLVNEDVISLSNAPAEHFCRPSVDVLFRSVAQTYGPSALGILLTGMGRDGATGLLEMHKAGGVTIAQDEASSAVFGMPKAAIELGAVDYVLPADEIANAITRLCPSPADEVMP